jgi:glycerol-3-phosphate dehydrogenase
MRIVPALKRESLVGGVQYHDAQVDDARHTMTIARTAAAYGAAVTTSVEAAGFLREAGRIAGVRVRDIETSDEFDLRARDVVSATGVWSDEVQEMAARPRIHCRASKGVHFTVPRDRIHSDSGMILRTEKSVLFIIPWIHPPHHRHWLIGTTDTDWTHDKTHPAATRADIEYLLDHVNAVLEQPLTHEDVEGVYAGLRPLLAGESEATSKLSREHAVAQTAAGLITVAGGKYTTYRIMAEDAVDAAARSLPWRVPRSVTASAVIAGSSSATIGPTAAPGTPGAGPASF